MGGIRDIEFIVQLMQLQYGGKQPRLRTAGTLPALQRLRHAGLLNNEETRELAEDYQFLRTLEHRLQLSTGFRRRRCRRHPDERERLLVARRMGFPDREIFEAELLHRRERVRGYLQHLFYADLAIPARGNLLPRDRESAGIGELLEGQELPATRARLIARLKSAGFQDTDAALHALQLPMRGNEFGGMPPDTPDEFKKIAPQLLSRLAHSPDADAGLSGVEALALAVPNRAQLYASFDDSPEVMSKLVTLAAVSPPYLQGYAITSNGWKYYLRNRKRPLSK